MKIEGKIGQWDREYRNGNGKGHGILAHLITK